MPFFSAQWFVDEFIKVFGYPAYILTQCGILFSTFLFLHTIFSFLLSCFKTFKVKKLLHNNITIIAALAHGFFGIVSSSLINNPNTQSSPKRYLKAPPNSDSISPSSSTHPQSVNSTSSPSLPDPPHNSINPSHTITSPPLPEYHAPTSSLSFTSLKHFPKFNHLKKYAPINRSKDLSSTQPPDPPTIQPPDSPPRQYATTTQSLL